MCHLASPYLYEVISLKKYLPFIIILLILCCSCNNEYTDENRPRDNTVIVTVNGEPILKSEIDPVYADYASNEDNTVTYEKIVEDTILEILVIQQADKYGISVTEEDVDNSIIFYKATYPDIYKELLNTYTENEIRKKLKDRLLFFRTKDYALEHIVPVTHEVIQNFIKEKNLSKELGALSDEEILKTLKPQIEEFSAKQWMLDLRETADIVYS